MSTKSRADRLEVLITMALATARDRIEHFEGEGLRGDARINAQAKLEKDLAKYAGVCLVEAFDILMDKS